MEEQREKKTAKILIVDDLGVNVSILENIVNTVGYEALCAMNVERALKIVNEAMPDLILSDYYMPDVDGLEFCRMLKKNPRTRDIPFLFITVADSNEEKRLAFEAGAVDYISKPFEPTEVIMRINNHLSIYQARQQIEENNRMMHQVITQQRRGMEQEQENMLIAMTKIIKMRNPRMGDHLERVGTNSRILAQSLQLSALYEEELNDEAADVIGTAAKLHDIGTLVVEDDVRNDRPLYQKLHTEQGEALLKEISADTEQTRFLDMACRIARYHHAHWDGSGCPAGISGTDIPLAARIVKVVNDYDEQLLNCAGSETAAEDAEQAIRDGSGTQYEPDIVEIFFKVIKRLEMP